MCGIVGFADKHIYKETALRCMMDLIVHRGPDGSGTYIDDTIALGHRRLSIIDLQGGRQPMQNEDGRLVCVFNGEIYNYKILKEELNKSGHIFATDSDTEVLLHGYEEWGRKLPLKLRGMFSFAIWDREKKELFCARDYFGIKPFYFYQKNDTFLFGSEMKSFLGHPDFEKELNEEQLELYLSYQYSPGEQTFFKNVYKLLPAHMLYWKNGEVKIERYWKSEFAPDCTKTLDEWSEEVRHVVEESVRMHQISDVEVGSFLSSGVDSCLITAMSGVDKSYTVGYEEKQYSEAEIADQFSQRLKCQHFSYKISSEEFREQLSNIQYYMDEPLADAACIALYFLNREASKHVKVCLSGEGADEIFGGYHIYKEPFICRGYDNIPIRFRRIVGKIAECLPAGRGINFLSRHGKALEERYIGNTVIFTERQKKKLLRHYKGKRKPEDLSKKYFCDLKSADDVTRMQYTDLHLWLAGDILLKADKMSMANSLEVRVPFLDKEVFRVARKIPTEFKVNRRQTKIVLRNAAKAVVGEVNAERKKRGFPVPVREWIKEEAYAEAIGKAFKSQAAEHFFDTEWLEKMLDEHICGKKDHWREIWCVYMFLLWYEEYFVKR